MSTITPVPASTVVVGDLLLLPESAADDIHTVEVDRIQKLYRQGNGVDYRVRIWVKTTGQAARLSAWNYGQFALDATVQKVTA